MLPHNQQYAEDIYEKIVNTIDRNDVKAAKHMLDKYQHILSDEDVKKITDLLRKKEKKPVRLTKKRAAKLSSVFWLGVLGKEGIQVVLVIIFLILEIINLPYMASYYYYIRSHIGNPQNIFLNDLIFLIMIMDISVFFGIASITKDGVKGHRVLSLVFAGMSLIFLIKMVILYL